MLSPQENMCVVCARVLARTEELHRRLFRTRDEVALMMERSPMLAPPLLAAFHAIKGFTVLQMRAEKWRIHIAVFVNCARVRLQLAKGR
jgi:hypothetical protein